MPLSPPQTLGRTIGPTPLRARLAVRGANLVGGASRRLHLGSGSTVGGRVGLAIDRQLLHHLGAERTVVLISGTNGKTTTTRMIAEAVATDREVATSRAGANMDAGLVAALASASPEAVGVLEVDEGHLPSAIDALAPAVIVLLNLSRDQLDRVSEVRFVAERWRSALARTDALVIANADDPLVAYAASSSSRVQYVGVGSAWREDAHHCPRCDAQIEFTDAAHAESTATDHWSCTCGFARPLLDASVLDGSLRIVGASTVPLDSRLPGQFNIGNVAMATLAASALGVDLAAAARAAGQIDEVEGRYATVTIDGRTIQLLLAKNPAGFAELLGVVGHRENSIVVGINAQVADGHDPSWLWDVPFELLAGRTVVATGERSADLAVRLLHAGVEVMCVDDQRAALAAADPGPITYIGNYTAFQEIRRLSVRERRSGSPDRAGEVPTDTHAHHVQPRPVRRPTLPVSTLRIVTVHPDLLGTYGDGGNGRVLENRARWAGIDVELIEASSDQPLPESADIYLLGGGEDGPQLASADALRQGALQRAVAHGAVVLGVCAGFQILGRRFPAPDGSFHRGLDVLDVETVRGAERCVGEIVVAVPGGSPLGDPGYTLSGFENHGGRTARGEGVEALGSVTRGIGNGDLSDGARVGRVFATYLHGPVLARNPHFADALLSVAVGAPIGPIDDPLADDLHDLRLRLAAPRQTGSVTRRRARLSRRVR
jgi:CobQ-like glutamine amidotransferase family enzyme/UDP-N-acetylmuramyl tripeptide synthase